MRIAIACDKGMVANIFSEAKSYEIYEDGKLSEVVEGSFHGARFIADFFAIKKIVYAVGRNMGEDLANELTAYNIGFKYAGNVTTYEAARLFSLKRLTTLVPAAEFNDENLSACGCKEK